MSTFISVPNYPNVPNVAGVPALIRKAGAVSQAVGYISHIDNVVERLIGSSAAENWGIYSATTGNQVLVPDTFLGIDYKNAYRLMDYPLEAGAFETYNKVANPFEASISMAKGGTLAERTAFLNTVDALVKDLNFYTIVTPEESYASVNLERYDYRRENRNGTHLIVVHLYFREIRVTAQVNGVGGISMVSPRLPSSMPARSLGQVAASAITSVQQAAIAGAARVLDQVKGIGNAVGTAAEGITL